MHVTLYSNDARQTKRNTRQRKKKTTQKKSERKLNGQHPACADFDAPRTGYHPAIPKNVYWVGVTVVVDASCGQSDAQVFLI